MFDQRFKSRGKYQGRCKKAKPQPTDGDIGTFGPGGAQLIYLMNGLLAVDVVPGKGGLPTEVKGAITEIGKQPGGMAWELMMLAIPRGV